MRVTAFLLSILLFNLHMNLLYADYMVITNKSVNLLKDNKVSARMDLDKKIIEGFGQITPSDNKGMYILDVTWTNILDKNGKTALPSNSLSTKTEIKGTVLTNGTGLLIKGSVSGNILGTPKEEEEKDDDKRDYLGSGGSTDISAGIDNPIDTDIPTGEVIQPDLITTYDGCNHLYNQEKETISVFQQTYYIDENNNKKIKEECHIVNEVPADKKSCSTVDDFIAHVTYTRFQPTFMEEGKTYSAGGCVIDKTYMHQMDYNVCEAVAYNDQYIKQGKWYYQIESGEKVYISDCVLDPYAEKNDLLIQFEGCPVYHDNEAGQSKYYGRYYWIKPDNTKEFLGECVDVGDDGMFIHKFRWEGEWNYGEDYAQQIMTRYIDIESESREVIIDDDELDIVKYNYDYNFVGWEHHDDKTPIHNAEDTHGGYSDKKQDKYFTYEGEKLSVPNSEFSEKIKHTFDYAYESRYKDCSGLHKGVENWMKDKIKRPDNTEYDSDEYHGSKHC